MNINSNHSQNHSHYSPIAYVEWPSCIISIYSIWCWIILCMVNGVKDFKVCLIFLVGLLSHMYVWVVRRCCRSRGLGQAFESDTMIFIIFRWLPKICTHLQDHNTCKRLTSNSPTNPIAYDGCSLIHYMHSQRIIDTATIEFIFLPINTHTPLFYGLPKTLPSLPYYKMTVQYKMMVQLIVSHPILPTSSSLRLEIFYHRLKTQNISSTSFKIFYHSQPMHPWSQLLLHPYTKAMNIMMMVYQLSFKSWRNKSISYPQTAHHSIKFTQSSISFLNIAPSVSWTHTSIKSSVPPWEQGWLLLCQSFHRQRET